VPVHFYSSIADVEDLKNRRIWDTKSTLVGIEFQPGEQLKLLSKLGKKYGDECVWPLDPSSNENKNLEYYINNPSFSYGCAASTHSMIRHYKPKRIIEIGSGMSSIIISKALKLNNLEKKDTTTYTIIDPYPSKPVQNEVVKFTKLIPKRVELVKESIFDQLKENDILFIDSSHSCKIGSDVNYLYLNVLPKLNPGVIIHIHDIALPYEYPKAYAINETFRQFWTEQYILQAFLSLNDNYEILLGMCYLQTDHLKEFQQAYPSYDPKKNTSISGSFWIRRKIKS
jgi:predicted O-methyltransferase YrrM